MLYSTEFQRAAKPKIMRKTKTELFYDTLSDLRNRVGYIETNLEKVLAESNMKKVNEVAVLVSEVSWRHSKNLLERVLLGFLLGRNFFRLELWNHNLEWALTEQHKGCLTYFLLVPNSRRRNIVLLILTWSRRIIFPTPKMFVWTRRMQFWQPCRIFFNKSPKSFVAQTKKIIIIVFSNFIFCHVILLAETVIFLGKRFHRFKRHL